VQLSALSFVHPNVDLGADAHIGEYVIVGVPPAGARSGELETRIGAGATIRSHTVIYVGNHIGARFSTGHGVMVRELNTIGDDVSVGTHSVIEHHVTLGDGVRIHSNVFIPEFSIIEVGAWVGPNVVMTNAKYPRGCDVKRDLKGPRLMPGAKIGANATLLPGVTIGRGAGRGGRGGGRRCAGWKSRGQQSCPRHQRCDRAVGLRRRHADRVWRMTVRIPAKYA
jgi:UDP-3-O-[3-hydroxymyristoyl] glucosamine N-acyltransferase